MTDNMPEPSYRVRNVQTPQRRIEDLSRYMLRLTGHTGADLRQSGKIHPMLKPIRWAIWTSARVCLDIELKELTEYFNVTRRSIYHGVDKTILCFMRNPNAMIPGEDMLLIQLVRECPWGENVESINNAIKYRFDNSRDWTENIKALFKKSTLEPTPRIKLKF